MSEDGSAWVLVDIRGTCECTRRLPVHQICAVFSDKDKAIEKLRKYKRSKIEYYQWLQLYKFPFDSKKSVTKLFIESRKREDRLEYVDIDEVDPLLDDKFIWILTPPELSENMQIYATFESAQKLVDFLKSRFKCSEYEQEKLVNRFEQLRPGVSVKLGDYHFNKIIPDNIDFYVTKTVTNEPYELEEDQDDEQEIEF